MKAARKVAEAGKPSASGVLTVSIEIDPLVEVVRRHVKLSARATRLIEGDFARLLRSPSVRSTNRGRSAAPVRPAVIVLSTQEAADLVGVSRPYIVARIEAGDIPPHQQVGNQRRVLKSAVEAWHRREQTRRRRALGQLGAVLDGEIFSRSSRDPRCCRRRHDLRRHRARPADPPRLPRLDPSALERAHPR